jgi:two-component system chemotaxis response regulator CheB
VAHGHDIIVVGASAGGLEALRQVVHSLPPGLPAALFVVCHFPAGGTSALPEILSRAGPVLATHARNGEPFYPGHIYVAPPDFHLLLDPGRMRLTRGARENRYRPAIDPLFRSAARVYGPRVIGVVLSGALHDGVAGLMAVRSSGGIAVVQDPHDAQVASMPQTAQALAGAEHVVPAARLAGLLAELVRRPAKAEEDSMTDPVEKLPLTMAGDFQAQQRNQRLGNVTVLTCPECGGSLWQVDDRKVVRFRCHVGHIYNGEVLLSEHGEALEAALWTAVRIFRDRGVLARQLAERERRLGHAEAARRFDEQAEEAERNGTLIQDTFLAGPSQGFGKFGEDLESPTEAKAEALEPPPPNRPTT